MLDRECERSHVVSTAGSAAAATEALPSHLTDLCGARMNAQVTPSSATLHYNNCTPGLASMYTGMLNAVAMNVYRLDLNWRATTPPSGSDHCHQVGALHTAECSGCCRQHKPAQATADLGVREQGHLQHAASLRCAVALRCISCNFRRQWSVASVCSRPIPAVWDCRPKHSSSCSHSVSTTHSTATCVMPVHDTLRKAAAQAGDDIRAA